MTVGQLCREMESWELTEWAGYWKIVNWERSQAEARRMHSQPSGFA